MDKKEMNIWLHTENSIDIRIPNEIFDDFNKASFKTWKHKGFAYAYYYLVNYIYRNCLYGKQSPLNYDQKRIIQSLTSKMTSVTYITKEKGLLEQIGYTQSTKEYPLYAKKSNGVLEFICNTDIDNYTEVLEKVNGRFKIRKPIRSFYRYHDDDELTGTFYYTSNTQKISIKTFIDIITNPNLGYAGLYVYSYLEMMCYKFKDGYQVTNKELSEAIGCGDRTISKYTNELETKGFIASSRNRYKHKDLHKIYKIKNR